RRAHSHSAAFFSAAIRRDTWRRITRMVERSSASRFRSDARIFGLWRLVAISAALSVANCSRAWLVSTKPSTVHWHARRISFLRLVLADPEFPASFFLAQRCADRG